MDGNHHPSWMLVVYTPLAFAIFVLKTQNFPDAPKPTPFPKQHFLQPGETPIIMRTEV